jgi:hypothetical protein
MGCAKSYTNSRNLRLFSVGDLQGPNTKFSFDFTEMVVRCEDRQGCRMSQRLRVLVLVKEQFGQSL